MGSITGGCTQEPPSATTDAQRLAYVGSDTCVTCHENEFEAWQDSQHQRALQKADPSTVLGDFTGSDHLYHGQRSEFQLDGNAFTVRTADATGNVRPFTITETIGISPLQQYLVTFADGRKQALPLVWDTRTSSNGGQRWMHLYPNGEVRPGDPLHWTGPYQNWNHMCADCHSTNLQKNYDLPSDTFDTRWSEMSVGCEACHGPSSLHVAWAQEPHDEYPVAGNGLVTPARSTATQLDSCARCHSRREQLAEGYYPGLEFLDYYKPALLEPGLYHADGQIDDEVYVYGSFLQSRMYQQGVQCTDCHNVHTAELKLQGNTTCTQCHNESPPARFETLRAVNYDSPSHHFHPHGSVGARCVNCHMPAKTYMQVDDRRDHSFRIPRPDVSLATGSPNACNACHDDESASWAMAEIRRRLPDDIGLETARSIASGRQGDPEVVVPLANLSQDVALPAIVRATALSLLGNYNGTRMVGAITASLSDPEPLVRIGAVRALQSQPAMSRWSLAKPLLDDPLLAVRTEAAQVLAGVPRAEIPQLERQRLDDAIDEYVATQTLHADRVESHLNIGNVYTRSTRYAPAERAYRAALTIDPASIPAMLGLAELSRAADHDEDAGVWLDKALQLDPDSAATRHAMGLWLVRQSRIDEARTNLKMAHELDPDNARYAYVYAIALNSAGDTDSAVLLLQDILQHSPDDTDTLLALITIERDRGNFHHALNYATKLLATDPGNARYVSIARQLKKIISGDRR